MTKRTKPRPDNKLTERYRGQLNDKNVSDYIKWQRKIGQNLIIVDDAISKHFCKEYKNKALYDITDSKWSPNIRYGTVDWPIEEWGYTIAKPKSDEFSETGMMNESKELVSMVKDYIKNQWDLDTELFGSHINCTIFGQDGLIHKDSQDGTHIFAIIFFNDDMNVYDGGELQTYVSLDPDADVNKDHHKSETNVSINPKIGRMVIADARILHRGLAPSRWYANSRMTVAIKFKFEDQKKAWRKLEFAW